MAFSVKTIRSMAAVMLILSADIMLPAEEKPPRSAGEQQDGIRKLRFVQDDAQDYMVSRIYTLKYVQSNDVMPFLLGMVKRYNMNSSVGCIEYGADNTQLLTVTCPVGMMPYVDDFIRKVDRNIEIDGKTPGDIIRGTGITRAVYRPKYRSGENLLNVLVNSVIGEGPYGSVYAWDANSNQIYWKDNSSNTEYVREFLGWIDRPAPQITFHFTLYEVRESMLRDAGLDYLAWKNGPGLNIFATAWEAFGVSSGGTAALQAVSGPFGGFFTAPQFDASFIRLLAQSGKAEIRNQASMTVSNSDSDSSELYFNPQFENIVKSNNDQTSVGTSTVSGDDSVSQLALKINQPIVNLHYGLPQDGYPATEAFSMTAYRPGEYAKYPGTICFDYAVASANVVERNNVGTELIETSEVTGSVTLPLNQEAILARWELDQDVTQTIGVPWLKDIPYIGRLFSTQTTTTEKTEFFLAVTVEMLNTAAPAPRDGTVGELVRIK